MNKHRDDIIDFLRSIAIVVFMFTAHYAMMSVEYEFYFPVFIRKVILLNETAIEGFLLLAGFAVGKYYLTKFKSNHSAITHKILIRVFKLIILQYFMILTISLPHYLVTTAETNVASTLSFLLASIAFYNQIGLIHILPTFICMFLIAPVILYMLAADKDVVVLVISLLLFVVAQIDPYILSYGEKPIFPVITFQVYFVIGCYLGKKSLRNNSFLNAKSKLPFAIAIIVMSIFLLLKHRLALPAAFGAIMNSIDPYHILYVSRYPQNIPALLYALSMWFFILQLSRKYWSVIAKIHCTKWLLVFGRNPLLSFVMHVYFVKSIEILLSLYDINIYLIYILITSNYVLGYLFLAWYEKPDNQMIKRPIQYLFN